MEVDRRLTQEQRQERELNLHIRYLETRLETAENAIVSLEEENRVLCIARHKAERYNAKLEQQLAALTAQTAETRPPERLANEVHISWLEDELASAETTKEELQARVDDLNEQLKGRQIQQVISGRQLEEKAVSGQCEERISKAVAARADSTEKLMSEQYESLLHKLESLSDHAIASSDASALQQWTAFAQRWVQWAETPSTSAGKLQAFTEKWEKTFETILGSITTSPPPAPSHDCLEVLRPAIERLQKSMESLSRKMDMVALPTGAASTTATTTTTSNTAAELRELIRQRDDKIVRLELGEGKLRKALRNRQASTVEVIVEVLTTSTKQSLPDRSMNRPCSNPPAPRSLNSRPASV